MTIMSLHHQSSLTLTSLGSDIIVIQHPIVWLSAFLSAFIYVNIIDLISMQNVISKALAIKENYDAIWWRHNYAKSISLYFIHNIFHLSQASIWCIAIHDWFIRSLEIKKTVKNGWGITPKTATKRWKTKRYNFEIYTYRYLWQDVSLLC